MCTGGNKQPSPPPRLPEAPKLADPSAAGAGNADERRRRAAGGTSSVGTILTGSRGAQQGAGNVAQNTLLGA